MYTQQEAQLAQIAKKNWYDRARFEAEILPKFKSWEIDAEGNIQEAPQKPKSMADVLGNVWNKQQEFTQGAVTGAIRWVWNIWDFLTRNAWKWLDWILPWTPVRDFLQPAGEKFRAWAESIASGIEWINKGGKMWLNPESTTSKVGEFAWQMALTAPIGGIAGKAVTTAWKVGLGALEGVLQGGAFDVASQEKLGAGTIAWWVIWWATPILWKAYNALSNWVTDKLPKSLVSSGLVTPSALKNASERLSRLSDDGIVDMESAPQWMLDKNLSGSKEKLQQQLSNIIKESWKKKISLLSSSKEWLGKVPEVKWLQNAMKSVLWKYAKITKKSVTPTPWNEELVKIIQSFVNNKNPTAIEVEKARSLLWNMQIFTKLWDFADSATKEWLQKTWVNISKYLDNAFPWFRVTNKDIEVATALSKAIGLKQAQADASKLVTMTNLWTGGAWASYGYAKEWDIAGALKYGAGALAGKALVNNPAFTTGLAQTLKSPMLKQGLKKTGKVVKKALKYAPQIISKVTQ
jgi:hypothetical protein